MRSCRVFQALAFLLLAAPAAADDAGSKAKEHFLRGTKLYDLQHYSEAAQAYEQAYQLKDEPALLFNIGQAYRLGGEPAKALGAYRSFLRRVPDSPNRNEVLALIDDLRKAIDAQKQTREKPPTGTFGNEGQPPPTEKPPETPPPVTPPPAPPPKLEVSAHDRAVGRTLRIAGLGVGAAGVAVAVVGIAFAVLTSQVDNEFNHPKMDAFYDPSLESRGRTYQTLEGVFLGIGVAAVVAGVAVYVVGVQKSKHRSLVVTPTPGGAGASLGWAF